MTRIDTIARHLMYFGMEILPNFHQESLNVRIVGYLLIINQSTRVGYFWGKLNKLTINATQGIYLEGDTSPRVVTIFSSIAKCRTEAELKILVLERKREREQVCVTAKANNVNRYRKSICIFYDYVRRSEYI